MKIGISEIAIRSKLIIIRALNYIVGTLTGSLPYKANATIDLSSMDARQ
jgi:hypothetical protein